MKTRDFPMVMALALLLTGCTLGEHAAVRSLILQQEETARHLCETEGGVRVLEPLPEHIDVLAFYFYSGSGHREVRSYDVGELTYRVADGTSRQDIIETPGPQWRSLGRTAIYPLLSGRIGAVDLRIQGVTVRPGDFARDPSEPDGVYRYTLVPAGDSLCAPYVEERDALVADGPAFKLEWYGVAEMDRRGVCLTKEFLSSPEDYVPEGHIYNIFFDDLPEMGVSQTVEQIIAPNGAIQAERRSLIAGSSRRGCSSNAPGLLVGTGLSAAGNP